jgi:ubiquinone/menaquinone biosynthesis C-methylase UbiE
MAHDIRVIAATFNERAKDDPKNDWRRHYAQRLVELAPVEPSNRVLDAGVGTGFAAVAIARKIGPCGHVLGVDVSPGMLQEAQAGCISL